jgi:hypothetical protein
MWLHLSFKFCRFTLNKLKFFHNLLTVTLAKERITDCRLPSKLLPIFHSLFQNFHYMFQATHNYSNHLSRTTWPHGWRGKTAQVEAIMAYRGSEVRSPIYTGRSSQQEKMAGQRRHSTTSRRFLDYVGYNIASKQRKNVKGSGRIYFKGWSQGTENKEAKNQPRHMVSKLRFEPGTPE